MRTWIAIVLCAVAACGKSSSKAPAPASGSGSATASASGTGAATAQATKPPPAAPVSAVCKAARELLGSTVTCVETKLPELTSPAGEVVRVMAKDDPVADYVYALVPPTGDVVIGRAGENEHFLDDLTGKLDLPHSDPLLLARLYATLGGEATVVRCVPGANDTLPPRDGKPQPCKPPALAAGKDGKLQLHAILEEFPDPRLLNRTEHILFDQTIDVDGGRLSSDEGNSIGELDAAAPRPADFPPWPTMTSPPDWVAAPVAASAADSDALCAAVKAKVEGFEGRACKAFGYPSIALPNGDLFYLANDAGERWVFAFKKKDGTIVAGFDLDTDSPLSPVIASYDPAQVPPATFLAAALLVHTTPAKIRCLPGANDSIPNVTCKPPTATKTAEGVTVEAIVEELPIPDEHGMIHDPAIRDVTWHFTPGGGYDSDGPRLVDLRPDSP